MSDPKVVTPVTVINAPSSGPLSKYSAALISIVLVVLATFTSVTHWDKATIIQLGLVFVSAVGTYAVPLLTGKLARWQAWGKTGVAAAAAVLTAFAPLWVHGNPFSPQSIALVVFAGLQVIGTHLGVDARTS